MKSVAFLLLTLLFLGSAAAANRNNPLPRDNMYVICSENDYECSRLKFMKDGLQTELGRLLTRPINRSDTMRAWKRSMHANCPQRLWKK
ncbi:MAG: hypothetical protein JAY89_12595, partial [Candidatus Thiodiazotropha taylori]|nr:hypothetical protein [Candidatus Thiodiazotropha taylori]